MEEQAVYTRRRIFIAIVLVLIIVLIGYIIIAALTPEDTVEEFKINKVVFASNVDDSFKYTQREVFKSGDVMWVYAELKDYPDYQYDAGLQVIASMDIVTINSSDEIVPAFTGNLVNIGDFVKNNEILYFVSSLDTSYLTPGIYTMQFTFTDLVSSLPLTTSKEFRIS